MVSLVTRNARSTATAIEDQLEARDIQGLGLMALAGATGVILAQEFTERVLPLLSMPREPASAVQFAVAGGVKLVLALIVGAVGAQMSGLLLVFLAFSAAGSVVFAGADFVNAVQRTGFLAESPARTQVSGPTTTASGGSGNAQSPSRGSPGAGAASAWG